MKEVLDAVRAEFRRLASTDVRALLDRFFQSDQRVDSYGIAAPEVQRVSRDVYRRIKKWPVKERDRLCTALWESGKAEEGSVVCYVYRRFGKQCHEHEFRLFTRWLDRYVNNWGHTDGLSLWLVGACIANEPSLTSMLDPWTRAKNRWKRRAAAVSLVPSARRGLHTPEILHIASALILDKDDMVQKGVGWLLKETYPSKPKEVMRFLLPFRAEAPRLILRYAAEKMNKADKARLLA